MTKERPISLLSIVIMALLSIAAGFFAGASDDQPVRFELIHRHSHGVAGQAPYERLRKIMASDAIRRRRSCRSSLKERQLLRSDDMGFPLSSATDLGLSEYVVSLKVGTPVQNFYLIADTGSSLTWIKCSLHKRDKTKLPVENPVSGPEKAGNGGDSQGRRFFKAYRSSTFRTIPCSSQMCRKDLAGLFSIPRCPAAKDPCAFDHGYISGDTTFGFFANDTVSIGHRHRGKRLHNMLIGCSLTYRGLDGADGVLGLGQNPFSFPMQAASDLGAKFSYCLVDHLSPRNLTAYLLFGQNRELERNKNLVQCTEILDANERYGVNLKGISVDGQMLDIPPSTWDFNAKGGAIVDSGSSTTFLTMPAYEPVTTALKNHLIAKYPKFELPPEAPIMDFCFNATCFNESEMPKLAVHFADGAVFRPVANGYIVEMGGPLEGVRCIGFQPADWPAVCIIGNILQQNHIWEYDLVNRRLAFAPSKCSDY